jgi:long-chain fatty acid transport protein
MLGRPGVLAASLASLLASHFVGRVAVASPHEQLGAGPVSQALSNTTSLEPEALAASAVNPAWLPRLREKSLTFGWQSTLARYRFVPARGEPGAMNESTSGLLFGVGVPIAIGGNPPRFALGLSAFVPEGLITRARARFVEEPQAPLLLDRLQTLSLDAGIGVSLGERWSAGLGVSALASFVGSIAVSADADGAVQTTVEDDLLAAVTPSFGAAVSLPVFDADELALSLSARGALESEVDLTLEPLELGGIALPELAIKGTVQYDPARVHAEAALRLGRFGAVVAATYKRWSALDGFLAATVECPESEPVCGSSPPPPLEASDTVVPRLAVSVTILERPRLALRGGYWFEASPLPEQRAVSNHWDNDRHVFGLGSGLAFRVAGQPVRWDVALQYHALAERRHQKRDGVPADNPGAPSVETRGRLIHGSFAWSLEF